MSSPMLAAFSAEPPRGYPQLPRRRSACSRFGGECSKSERAGERSRPARGVDLGNERRKAQSPLMRLVFEHGPELALDGDTGAMACNAEGALLQELRHDRLDCHQPTPFW